MSKLEVISNGEEATIPVVRFKEIPVGTVFFGKVGYERGVFLRFLYGVIKVGDDKLHTWTSDIGVEDYRAAKSAKLTVE